MSKQDIKQWVATPDKALVVKRDSWGRCAMHPLQDSCDCAKKAAEVK